MLSLRSLFSNLVEKLKALSHFELINPVDLCIDGLPKTLYWNSRNVILFVQGKMCIRQKSITVFPSSDRSIIKFTAFGLFGLKHCHAHLTVLVVERNLSGLAELPKEKAQIYPVSPNSPIILNRVPQNPYSIQTIYPFQMIPIDTLDSSVKFPLPLTQTLNIRIKSLNPIPFKDGVQVYPA